MPVDKDAEIAQILLELGTDSGSAVGTALPGIWDSFGDKALIGPRLQGLYTRRAAVDILLGSVWQDVDVTDEQLEVSLQQQSAQLASMRERYEAEIAAIESRLRAARSPVAGALTATSPTPVPPNAPDPNDPAYRGSPLYSTIWKGE